MAKKITSRQSQILYFIKNFITNKGYPPSVREICNGVGLSSTSTVHAHLSNLEKKGYIKRDPTKPRAIELLGFKNDFNNDKIIKIPIIGDVTAGKPILAIENIEDNFYLSSNFFNFSTETFMLTIKGYSMLDAVILNGYFLIFRKQNQAENGDIVVVLIDEESTVKRFYKEKNRIRLQPENKNYKPIYITDVNILGKVIGIVRKIN